MDLKITEINLKKLIKSQQGELDAVVLYRKLANMVGKEYENIFFQIASDEGKHASVLKKYTKRNLRPKKFKAIIVSFIYKIFGLRITLNIISKGEIKASEEYEALVKDFSEIKEIILNERRHGELLKNIIQ